MQNLQGSNARDLNQIIYMLDLAGFSQEEKGVMYQAIFRIFSLKISNYLLNRMPEEELKSFCLGLTSLQNGPEAVHYINSFIKDHPQFKTELLSLMNSEILALREKLSSALVNK